MSLDLGRYRSTISVGSPHEQVEEACGAYRAEATSRKAAPAGRDASPQDRTITCCEPNCGAQFVFTVAEQKFFAQNNFRPPRRCRACRNRMKTAADAAVRQRENAFDEARAIGMALHDESEADDDGFISGAGFDRYGGFPGDGLSRASSRHVPAG